MQTICATYMTLALETDVRGKGSTLGAVHHAVSEHVVGTATGHATEHLTAVIQGNCRDKQNVSKYTLLEITFTVNR